MNLRETIQDIVKDKMKLQSIRVAEVVSVSGSECVVMLPETETEVPGVKLQTDVASGVLLVPSVGSNVIIGQISDFDYCVLMFSGLDSITFLDGSYGGLVKVSDLVGKLNALENKVNQLITWGLTVSPPFSPSTLLQVTQVSDIENDKITHGAV